MLILMVSCNLKYKSLSKKYSVPCKLIIESWLDTNAEYNYWRKDTFGFNGFRDFFINTTFLNERTKCSCDNLKINEVINYFGKPDYTANWYNNINSTMDTCFICYKFGCFHSYDREPSCLFYLRFNYKKSDSLVFNIYRMSAPEH